MFYFLDNSLDQKKLNEYNIPGFIEKPQGTPVKTKEKSIEEEIKFLTQLSLRVQEKNENYKKLIEEKIKTKSGYQTIDEELDYEGILGHKIETENESPADIADGNKDIESAEADEIIDNKEEIIEENIDDEIKNPVTNDNEIGEEWFKC